LLVRGGAKTKARCNPDVGRSTHVGLLDPCARLRKVTE
jgi:hypothetical protein